MKSEIETLRAQNASLRKEVERLSAPDWDVTHAAQREETLKQLLAEEKQKNTLLIEAARHIVELGYDRYTQGTRWCRFCGRNPVNGHLRRLEGDLRPCPLGELEKALFTPPSPSEAPSGGSDLPSPSPGVKP